MVQRHESSNRWHNNVICLELLTGPSIAGWWFDVSSWSEQMYIVENDQTYSSNKFIICAQNGIKASKSTADELPKEKFRWEAQPVFLVAECNT